MRGVTPALVDPLEVLSVATFRIRRGQGLCRALARIPPDQALLRDAGRAFHVFVGIGKDASEEVRREAFGVLERLRLDPSG